MLAAEGRELVLALLGADGDQTVPGAQHERRPGAVDPPGASLDGEHEHAGLGLDPEVLERASVRRRARLTIVSALVSSVSSSAICTTGCSGSPCSTYQVMSRAASQIDSEALASRIRPRSSSTLRASGAARSTQDSSSSCEPVAPRLERSDLGRERAVVEQDRGVREADGRLGQVLHLDEDVDRAVELRQRRGVVLGCRGERRARRPARGPG